MSAIISKLVLDGVIDAKSYVQNDCFTAAKLFAQTEGIVPAPESSHAVRAAIDEAILAKAHNEEKTILFCLSGHGFLDLGAYEAYLDGNLEDFELTDEAVQSALDASVV